jgi:hypothetical protein
VTEDLIQERGEIIHIRIHGMYQRLCTNSLCLAQIRVIGP